MADTNNQNSFLDYAGLSLFWNNVKNIIKDNELVTATALTNLDSRVDILEGSATGQMISMTYLELKALRDANSLVPGQQYRITDYTCTTRERATTSAGHPFDIIVKADSINKLNEEARAIQHEGDMYFSNCNLSVWKIWYCLDNDTNRFGWAVPADKYITVANLAGSTQIEVKYVDTKNIGGTSYDLWRNDSTAPGNYFGTKTLAVGESVDHIQNSGSAWIVNASNIGTIRAIREEEVGKGVIYHMIDEFGNDCPYDFKNIQFYRLFNSYQSVWSTISPDNTGVPCYTFSSIGDGSTTTFTDMSLAKDNYVMGNIIKEFTPLADNTIQILNNNCFFGDYILYNTFEPDCYNNTMTYLSKYNTFGCFCHDNIFNYSCNANSFGGGCSENIFNCMCSTNHFGDGCIGNILGSLCGYNYFGSGCSYIKFTYSSSSTSTAVYSYYYNNYFGDGCQYIVLKGEGDADNTHKVQNYKFAQGISGTSSSYLTIDGVRNRSFETKVAKNSNGVLKIYCEADLIK